jgi:hypothetical protein
LSTGGPIVSGALHHEPMAENEQLLDKVAEQARNTRPWG